ncbi:MAG TPA: RHS domain-containing protein [Anaeromyxobacter sp.]|nr:RHS domain-containing protein [Anaeromyxobacter sp.]
MRDSDVSYVQARFRYDARNRRIARWSSSTGQWTYYVHAPSGELLSELRSTGDAAQPWAPVRDYLWLDGRPLAQLEYVTPGAAPRPYYVHADQLGTPRKLTSAEGAVVWSATVQPYGEIAETTAADPVTGNTVVTNLRLPGQYDERLLGSLGLQGPYYNWNRWYLPGVGRYLELDPDMLNGSWGRRLPSYLWRRDISRAVRNWYSYADSSPLVKTDPTGRETKQHKECVEACVVAGLGCVATANMVCYLTGPGIPMCELGGLVCCGTTTYMCTRYCDDEERERCGLMSWPGCNERD